ncbi:MAG: SDR family oxidoreductase [Candidatus Dormibacteraeota bacterium]|nr:SDR family oxidoreductase [Candidatus Dormibacteraeota bacterium]
MQPDPLFDIAGRVAIVTGATSGLGERFARALSSRGAHVVVAGRREARLQALLDDLGSERTRAITCDVTDEAAVVRAVQQVVDEFGRLDIMVNNAGAADGGPAEREELSAFQAVMDLNVAAVFVGCREAAKAMLPAGRGSIINIASIVGFVSLSERQGMAGYTASKHAVVGLTRELGAQWARRGIRVNAIGPGWFPSEMTGQLSDSEHVHWIEQRTPMRRPGRIDELDGALIFLASDASSYMVGQTVLVDGGWTVW